MKCLYTMAGSSLFSLLVVVCLIHFSMVDWGPGSWEDWVWGRVGEVRGWWKLVEGRVRSEL